MGFTQTQEIAPEKKLSINRNPSWQANWTISMESKKSLDVIVEKKRNHFCAVIWLDGGRQLWSTSIHPSFTSPRSITPSSSAQTFILELMPACDVREPAHRTITRKDICHQSPARIPLHCVLLDILQSFNGVPAMQGQRQDAGACTDLKNPPSLSTLCSFCPP